MLIFSTDEVKQIMETVMELKDCAFKKKHLEKNVLVLVWKV